MKLSELGVKRPVTTMMVFLSIFIIGVVAFRHLAVDMMPEIEAPSISVFTTWSGASTEDMESKVTRVIESALGSVTDLDEILSSTSEGVSRVTCKFKWGTELGEASNDMRDLLERAKRRLPDDADTPVMFKFNSANMPIMFFSVTAVENVRQMEKLVNDEIVDALKRVPGVGSADAFGGFKRQVNVLIDPEKLAAYGLSLADIKRAIASENRTEPAGTIKIGKLDYTIRVPGEFSDPAQIADVIVKRDGSALVKLSEVAIVEDDFVEENNIAETNGKRAMVVMVQKRSGENTVTVCERVHEKMEEIKLTLPADYSISLINDSSEIIQRSISAVGKTVLFGGLFVILTTLFFLRSIRTSLVIVLTIPFSLKIAFIFMFAMGWTINIMSLSALSIAIGMVVDNAVVVLENIISHMSRGTSRREASMFGADEVGLAVMASTLTTIVVFLPLIFVEGVAGIMMKQLGGLVVATLLASVACALYLTPMLASKLIPEIDIDNGKEPEKGFMAWSENIFISVEKSYGHLLAWAMRFRWFVVAGAAIVIGITVFGFTLLGSEFLGKEDTGDLNINYELPLSTRYEITAEIGREILKVVKHIIGEENIRISSLSAGGGGGGFGGARASHIGNIRIRLVNSDLRPKSTDQYADEITSEVKNWAEIVKISARSNDFMSRILMGGDSNLRIDIFGYDLDAGYEVAQRLFHIINETQGTRNARIFQDMGNPELSVKVDRDRAASVGLTMDDITAAVSTLFQGTITTQYREGEDGYDILLRLEEKYRRTLEDIRRSELKIPTGEVVRLDTVAEVIETTGPVTISRKNQERRVSVFFDTIDRPQGDVMNDVRDRVEKEILLPSGTSIEYGGMIEEQEKSERVMIMMISLGLILVFRVMAPQFESFIHPFIKMVSIPVAYSGVVAVLGITDTPLGMT
ncbi:MAG: efflux RND transporter permease subunit, partial [Lentisphaerae bacterium]|nr:efflux RND transporter permease subunit [Lentisphaerota bacterium]